MVPEPRVALTRREHEAVGVREVLERGGAGVPPGDGVREPAADTVGDGRPDEEVAGLDGQRVEHLAREVVGNRTVIAGEPPDRRRRVVIGDRHRRQRERTRPALGPLEQERHLAIAHRPAAAGQQLARLLRGERQRVGPDLTQLAGQPKARQREGRVATRGEHEPERERGKPQDGRHAVEHARVVDLVEVVEHEHRRRAVVDQRGRERGRKLAEERREGGRRDRVHDPVVGQCAGAGERRHDRAPEASRAVVVTVERDPRESVGGEAGRRPRGEQRRLAGPGRAGDQCHPTPRDGGGQAFEQPFAAHHAMPQPRRLQLGGRDCQPGRPSPASPARTPGRRRGRRHARGHGPREGDTGAREPPCGMHVSSPGCTHYHRPAVVTGNFSPRSRLRPLGGMRRLPLRATVGW